MSSCALCDGALPEGARPHQRFCSRSCASKAASRSRDLRGEGNPRWRGGATNHPLYEVYHQMRARCENPDHPRYADYGGRGVNVCPEWQADFWRFVADVGERPPGRYRSGYPLWTLDRIDNSGDYAPGNVRWATVSTQAQNSRPSWPGRERNEKGQFA